VKGTAIRLTADDPNQTTFPYPRCVRPAILRFFGSTPPHQAQMIQVAAYWCGHVAVGSAGASCQPCGSWMSPAHHPNWTYGSHRIRLSPPHTAGSVVSCVSLTDGVAIRSPRYRWRM